MLTLEDLTKTTIGIVGFGKEGQAVARYLMHHNLSAVIYDEQDRSSFSGQELAHLEANGFKFILGESLSDFGSCAVLFRSPGIRRLHPAFTTAEAHGSIITSQTKFFFDHCRATIIGVTGTKGKGTTATLIARILDAAQVAQVRSNLLQSNTRVYVTGNIGKVDPFDILDSLNESDIVIFELSSFQLQDLTRSPHIGVCLMVTQEHLDHHVDLAEYHAAKSAIVAHQVPSDFAVYSDDYAASQAIGVQSKGTQFSFSRYHAVEYGAYAEENSIHLAQTPQAGVMDVSQKLLPGAHNLENMCAASIVASIAGVPTTVIQNAVVHFSGLEHRLEFVGEFGDVKFYNDSISTVPESTMAALDSFTAPTVLIVGGSEKNSDFTELAKHIVANTHIRGLIVVGVTAPRIIGALENVGFKGLLKQDAQNMAEIFTQVHELAHSGDVVLLSPACASFGMFKNYKERGEKFREAAKGYMK